MVWVPQALYKVLVKYSNMKNEKLQKICDTYKDKSNKELSNILVNLNTDFNRLKQVMLELAITLGEVEDTHDKVYYELQKRLKFKDNEQD